MHTTTSRGLLAAVVVGGCALAVAGTWRLAVRYVARAAGPRKGIPGDAPTRAVIKKY